MKSINGQVCVKVRHWIRGTTSRISVSREVHPKVMLRSAQNELPSAKGAASSPGTSHAEQNQMPWPIGSMYAIYGNIYHQYTPNVSIYTIHGSYGWWSWWTTQIHIQILFEQTMNLTEQGTSGNQRWDVQGEKNTADACGLGHPRHPLNGMTGNPQVSSPRLPIQIAML